MERLRGRLDHLLEAHLERGLDSLPGPVRIQLEMGLYQLRYMDSVPDYAAVSQTVAGVKAVVGPGLAPLANAVLRRAHEAGDDPDRFPDQQEDPVGFLSTWGSHPRWLVERWVDRWGAGATAELIKANNQVPEVTVRPIRASEAEAKEILATRQIDARSVGTSARCLAIEPARRVAEALEAIEGYAQDPAAAAVADYCGFASGSRIADLCAAPGGKALALASAGIDVVALDRSPSRIRLVRSSAIRLGASVHACVADAAHAPLVDMDGILLDAPCTGTGTLRRHPDARWKLTETALATLASIQRNLLEAAAAKVRPGGTLVYATCSLEHEENEAQVERFLTRHAEFNLQSPPQAAFEGSSDATGAALEGIPNKGIPNKGILNLLPMDTGYDGAFAARMVRLR